MATIAGRTLPGRRTAQGWAGWILLALPTLGIGSFLYASTQTVVKPPISLAQAVGAGDLDAIHAHALTGTDLNELGPDGHTALYRAIDDEGFDIALALIKDGAKPDVELKGLETPLMRAASKGHIASVRALLEAGAKPNVQLANGMTALYGATMSGSTETVQLLLKAGADPNPSTTNSVRTPIALAAWRGDLQIVKLLIAAGADVTSQKSGHESPLKLAASRNHSDVVKELSRFFKTS